MTFAKKCATVLSIVGLITVVSASSDRRSEETTRCYGQIRGHVLSADSCMPLAFANVILVGTNKGAMSLGDGVFMIQGVRAGTYTVKAMMMGYKTLEKRKVVVRANETTEIMFRLKVTIVAETQAIEVTGERKMIDVTSNGVRSSVTEEQVKEMAVDSAIDAIARKSGITRTGDQLHARGGRSAEIQNQIDAPVEDPLAKKKPAGEAGSAKRRKKTGTTSALSHNSSPHRNPSRPLVPNTEAYARVDANAFLGVIDHPMSTFSIDVDAASYSNVRRFIRAGALPRPDAIRVEELVNYFQYDYPEPQDGHPFSISAEMSECPWNATNKLVHIGLQGRRMDLNDLPPSNLVFLLDVSGSMKPQNKLPLLKTAFRFLTDALRRDDRVAIVTYSSTARLVLPPTRGDEKGTILRAIECLHAGGSTAGGAGIQLAYQTARENFLDEGNNRVILATDGDFNVGVSSDAALVKLIEKERESGIFLSVLGLGTGNLKDSKMEQIADKGNGHYAYIDNILEANKVMVREVGGTLFTIAKDVKIQVQFNPAKVSSYRLIGYENRLLSKEDFADDKKDAGELGAGHSVTALYEIVPVNPDWKVSHRAEFEYFQVGIDPEAYDSAEILTVKFRYKPPETQESHLISKAVLEADTRFDSASDDFRFSAAVAEFGMLLGNSQHKGNASFEDVLEMARGAKGPDNEGYRAEFIQLVETCSLLAKK